ncbi:MAG: M24 family metallopeptidase, partial [Acidimicrobiales bacterium]
MDRASRLDRVRRAMAEAECDAVVVTNLLNIRWLSGFTGSNGIAVITEDGFTIVTDGRYQTQIGQQLAAAQVEASVTITREIEAPIVAAVGAAERIGLESDDVSWADQRRFAEWLPGGTLIATSELIEYQRRFKDSGEVARLRLAASIADRALSSVKPELDRSRSELEVARQLDAAMLELGADDVSFPTIVAAGPNSAKPHATPSDRTIEPGDMVVIDFGAKVDGYGSDMTRSFLVGRPTPRQQEVFDAVAPAQAAGVAAVRHGVDEQEIDRVCRQEL